MSKNIRFFVRLTVLTFLILIIGQVIIYYQWLNLPQVFTPLVGFYFLISAMAFFINLKGRKKESEIAVWYYLSSVMIKFLLAAASVFVLTKFYNEERSAIIWLSFVLYPLYEAVVTSDIYSRIR